VSDENLEIVADASRDDGDREAEKANARLMAAAPELVEAVQVYLATLQQGMQRLAEHGVGSLAFQAQAEQSAAALDALKAVVRKALGQ
jgi:rRNA maturation endonuclease Nob1